MRHPCSCYQRRPVHRSMTHEGSTSVMNTHTATCTPEATSCVTFGQICMSREGYRFMRDIPRRPQNPVHQKGRVYNPTCMSLPSYSGGTCKSSSSGRPSANKRPWSKIKGQGHAADDRQCNHRVRKQRCRRREAAQRAFMSGMTENRTDDRKGGKRRDAQPRWWRCALNLASTYVLTSSAIWKPIDIACVYFISDHVLLDTDPS